MTTSENNNLPLSGITVIDCGQVVAGPTIAMILGDFGAEVIKVENPQGGDQGRYFGRSKNGVPLQWKQLGRNKKNITLSLSKPAGQDLFCKLIQATQADVLIEQLVTAKVAVAPVYDFKDLAEDPHLNARGVNEKMDDPDLGTLRMPTVQPRLSETPGRIAYGGQPMGVCNEEVIGGRLGLNAAEMAALKADGVI